MKRILCLLLLLVLLSTWCIPVMAGPITGGARIEVCSVCGESFRAIADWETVGTPLYTDYYDVEEIPGLTTEEDTSYSDVSVALVYQNGGIICPNCLEEIVNEYKASGPALPEPVTMTTPVTYTGTGSRAFTVTIPEALLPGQTTAIQASGTWASNETLNVTAESSVTLTGSGGGTTTLGITFPGIKEPGNNEYSVSTSANLTVGAFTPLFGTWSGSFQMTVSFNGASTEPEPEPELITFTVWDSLTYQAEAGMTWAQWCASDYREHEYWCSDNYVWVDEDGTEWLTTGLGGDPVSPSDQIISGNNYWSNWFGDFEG